MKNLIAEAQKKAQEAIDAARKAKPQAPAPATAGPDWDATEALIADAMEHAGISGVDVQLDGGGFATVAGVVTSEVDRDTALGLVQSFPITGMDVNVDIVAPPPVEAAPEAPLTAMATHTVKAGESWWGIAQRFYGNGKLWGALKAHNGNPRMLHPGHTIELPPEADLPKV